ncbi:pyridoxine 5'-phosphate synthase [Lentisphaera profundi]|uniref:Pyridoxine 5'-phosphate synthase n=1 Tax=Lentisphaera profundi TaxID=1658616 RepID=A0ABY7VVZ2_9BACT|nr:pyridoxine 5'-phosphate synthase [Lentisphaera profundi]WDE97062.1 pyridoxine 5'-phosphate synthase [Lentisphaera profundi]
MTALSVNINKIALLRNSRGCDEPNVLQFSKDLIKHGAQGITLHPRPDGRHALYSDVTELKKNIDVELNVEGYPSEDFLQMVCEAKPDQCTLVPDPPGALTSDSGWDCEKNMDFLESVVARLKAEGIRVSIFLNPDPVQVNFAMKTGTDRIELYTQAYAETYGTDAFDRTFAGYFAAAARAVELGLVVNAGHDLNQENLTYLRNNLPGLAEVSIGHALISEMLYQGMETTIKNYLDCLS